MNLILNFILKPWEYFNMLQKYKSWLCFNSKKDWGYIFLESKQNAKWLIFTKALGLEIKMLYFSDLKIFRNRVQTWIMWYPTHTSFHTN